MDDWDKAQAQRLDTALRSSNQQKTRAEAKAHKRQRRIEELEAEMTLLKYDLSEAKKVKLTEYSDEALLFELRARLTKVKL